VNVKNESNTKTTSLSCLLLLSELLKPLLGCTRSWGRCWAAIQLSYRPEPSGHAVHGEVDGLDIGGHNGRYVFCATLTHHKGGHVPFLQAGAEMSDTSAEAVKPDPGSSWVGHSGGVGAGVGDENAESCEAVHPLHIPLVIRPPCCTCCQIN